MNDFLSGPAHLARREQALSAMLTSAEDMYIGQQHLRLMRGIRSLREQHFTNGTPLVLDLWVLSAGYGLVPGKKRLAPYDCSFQGMSKRALSIYADALHVPSAMRCVLSQPHDLALVLLGGRYLDACALDTDVYLGGLTLFFCGSNQAGALPRLPSLRAVVLSHKEAKHFSCGLVALKGELAARLLVQLAIGNASVEQLLGSTTDVLSLVQHNPFNDDSQTVDYVDEREREDKKEEEDDDTR